MWSRKFCQYLIISRKYRDLFFWDPKSLFYWGKEEDSNLKSTLIASWKIFVTFRGKKVERLADVFYLQITEIVTKLNIFEDALGKIWICKLQWLRLKSTTLRRRSLLGLQMAVASKYVTCFSRRLIIGIFQTQQFICIFTADEYSIWSFYVSQFWAFS